MLDRRTFISFAAASLAENSKFNILVKSADDFSYLPEIEKKDKITLSQFALKELIRQTIFTVNDADKNKILTGK